MHIWSDKAFKGAVVNRYSIFALNVTRSFPYIPVNLKIIAKRYKDFLAKFISQTHIEFQRRFCFY